VFVSGVGHFAFFALEHDGDDLVLEVTGFDRALGTVVAFHGQSVLHVAGDAEFGGHVFSSHTHVDGVEGVVQGTHHHVNHLHVTHAGTPAGGQAGVGATAHVLGTATNGDVGVTQQNALAGVDDGLQARTAQAVDVVGGCAFAATTVDGGHAAQVHVFGFGVDHMAEHHVTHVFAIHASTRQRFAHDQRGQFGGGGVLQAAAVGTDGGTHAADNNNFSAHGDVSDWVGGWGTT
jgi:hypothetical protein